MSLIIRPVERRELPILCALAERTFRDAWQVDNEPEAFERYCRENFSLEKMNAELVVADSEFYFALINDQPAAYLKLNIDRKPKSSDDYFEKALQLERIYVIQSVQSQGLGAQLLHFTETRAREMEATWIWLTVWQKAPRTIEFYEKNGFEIFGVETFWLGDDPQPDWLMRKNLHML